MNDFESKIKWCIEQHRKTNHLYDDYLPYEFHLRMVVGVANDFKKCVWGVNSNYGGGTIFDAVILACWGHDLIEDTRASFNDVMKVFRNDHALEIVYAVTNEKGRNRKERASDTYYDGIRKKRNAAFVKVCDRISNVMYSKLTNSKMLEMYRKENDHFKSQLFTEQLSPMFEHLETLLA